MRTTNTTATLAELIGQDRLTTKVGDVFFRHLLEIVGSRPVDPTLGECLKTYVCEWLAEHPLAAFDNYSDDTYQRTYLGRCPTTGWEAIVMTWKCGNATSVHAHPQFAGYNIADGKFRVEVFEQSEDGAVLLRDTVVVEGLTGFYAVGEAGRFDNHIHRITCLSDTGHSLHVYSDDALRGCVYRLPGR